MPPGRATTPPPTAAGRQQQRSERAAPQPQERAPTTLDIYYSSHYEQQQRRVSQCCQSAASSRVELGATDRQLAFHLPSAKKQVRRRARKSRRPHDEESERKEERRAGCGRTPRRSPRHYSLAAVDSVLTFEMQPPAHSQSRRPGASASPPPEEGCCAGARLGKKFTGQDTPTFLDISKPKTRRFLTTGPELLLQTIKRKRGRRAGRGGGGPAPATAAAAAPRTPRFRRRSPGRRARPIA